MAPGGGREFNCTWESCGKSFNRKSDLCRHFRIHTNERPYQCMVKDCNKSFIQRSALTVHSRTHTGEKPHVCDNEGCRKAFSDSSSLARHRRIHTGKRPYICTEPTCDRSFCRKTTLTKHQHRSHRPGIVTRPSSEDAASEQSYPPSVAVSVPSDSYVLAQQPFYSPQSSTPSHEYYPPPRLSMAHLPAPQEPVTMMGSSIPVTTPVDAPHSQHFAQIMHQRFDPARPPYVPSDYHHHHPHHQHHPPPLPPLTYTGHSIGEGHPMMPYHSNYQYKQPARILNQPEGTDWGFLGVG